MNTKLAANQNQTEEIDNTDFGTWNWYKTFGVDNLNYITCTIA